MKTRNSPIGFGIATGVLALSLYFVPNRGSLKSEQEKSYYPAQDISQPTTQREQQDFFSPKYDYTRYAEGVGQDIAKSLDKFPFYTPRSATQPASRPVSSSNYPVNLFPNGIPVTDIKGMDVKGIGRDVAQAFSMDPNASPIERLLQRFGLGIFEVTEYLKGQSLGPMTQRYSQPVQEKH